MRDDPFDLPPSHLAACLREAQRRLVEALVPEAVPHRVRVDVCWNGPEADARVTITGASGYADLFVPGTDGAIVAVVVLASALARSAARTLVDGDVTKPRAGDPHGATVTIRTREATPQVVLFHDHHGEPLGLRVALPLGDYHDLGRQVAAATLAELARLREARGRASLTSILDLILARLRGRGASRRIVPIQRDPDGG